MSNENQLAAKKQGRSVLPRILYGVAMFLLGIAFIVYRDKVEAVLGFLIGALFVFSGLITLILFFINKEKRLVLSLISGLLELIFGVFVLVEPKIIFNYIVIIFGVCIFITGAVLAYLAFQDKKVGIVNWRGTLIVGIILIVMGILMMAFSGAVKSATEIVIGISLIITGILSLVSALLR